MLQVMMIGLVKQIRHALCRTATPVGRCRGKHLPHKADDLTVICIRQQGLLTVLEVSLHVTDLDAGKCM